MFLPTSNLIAFEHGIEQKGHGRPAAQIQWRSCVYHYKKTVHLEHLITTF
jgi:hypothetical protein